MRSRWIVAAVAVGLAATVGWLALSWEREDPLDQPVGGAFRLTDTEGKTVRARDFLGQTMVVVFGYTHCPDVCPMSLANVGRALEILEQEAPDVAEGVVPVFITLDPERDTVAAMRDYTGLFHPRTVGLTGTPEAVRKAADAYAVVYNKAFPPGSTSYLVDHSAFMFIMGPDGTYRFHLPYDVPPEFIARRIQDLATS